MNANSPSNTPNNVDRRLCKRFSLERPVKLTLDSGLIINAMTDDVSLGGVKVTSPEEFKDCSGASAVLQLWLDDEHLSAEFSCKIVRCESQVISLELERKKAAAFGMLVTRGLLKQKS